ncbi:FtsK/SpoIIIE domain-containing protein [Exiguobacterium sp. s193]|uniref:FtsK/SpoIIIE domain-containing protein n=1 Tax=Exiguobacterium sp. s193 TaxID=2751207 RepID=UPI001BE9248E|nr:FtsK/SpoIIIE domain-containing protein [Exiguobacterium sp. s193]
MSSQMVISKLLASNTFMMIKRKSFGILLKDLPDFSYMEYLKSLNTQITIEGEENPIIFFVGFFDEELIKVKQEMIELNGKFDFFYTVEDAEMYRNKREINKTRIIIVKRDIPKLSSLNWYEKVETNEIYSRLCDEGQKLFKDINLNDPLYVLWKAFKHSSVRKVISLDRLADYFDYFIENSENIDRDIVKEMYRLGLLIDKKLFFSYKNSDNEIKNIESIRRRIIENKKVVIRLSDLDKGDQKALQSSEIDKANLIRSNILLFYRTRNNEILKNLDIESVELLLSKVNKKKRQNTNENKETEDNKTKEKSKKANSPNSVGVNLLIDHDNEQLEAVIDSVEDKFETWEKGKKDSIRVESDDAYGSVTFIPEVYNLINALIGDSTYGGIINANDKSPIDTLSSLSKNTNYSFDDKFIENICIMLQQFEDEITEAVGILSIFESFINARNDIYPYVHRLADIPILKISQSKEISQQFTDYIEKYSRLTKKLKDCYNLFSKFSSSGTKELIAQINSIDVVYFVGQNRYHAILSPLNPLYLWKYVELARRLGETSSNLNSIDKEFLIRASSEIPNPLTTIFISNFISNNGDHTIPEIGTLGNLPMYSSEQQVNQAKDGLQAIEKGILKYLNVYPHSSIGLRIAFINPPDIQTALNQLKELIASNRLSGAYLEIYKTKDTANSWANLEDISENIMNKFSMSKENNFRLKVNFNIESYDSIIDKVNNNNFHIVVLFDPSKKTVTDSIRENKLNLKIHPLCVPRVFNYDPVTDKLDIIPSSEGNIFSDHHELIARLNDRPRSWHNTVLSDAQLNKSQLKLLLDGIGWLIVADTNLKNLEISSIGSENSLYYQSGVYRDVGIYSSQWDKFAEGLNKLVRSIGNYNPKEECLKKLLKEIQKLNEKSILHLASSSNELFNTSHAKGALGTAISAYWYKKQFENSILVSLDTDLARNWLSERSENNLSDLIGFVYEDDKNVRIDIVEVKTYGAYTIKNNEISGDAVEQVESVYKIIKEVFYDQDKITSASRRELLRFQVFKVLHQLNLTKQQKREWTSYLNNVFAGNVNIKINLSIHHVCFNDQGTTQNEGIKYHAENTINLIKIKDDVITEVLTDCNKLSNIKEFNSEVSEKSHKKTERIIKEIGKDTNSFEDYDSKNKSLEENIEKSISKDDVNGIIESEYGFHNQEKNKDEPPKHFSPELTDLINKTTSKLYRAMTDYSIDVLDIDPENALVASRFIRFRVRLRPGEKLQKVLNVRTDIAREIEATSEVLIDNEKGTNFVIIDVPRDSSDVISLLDHINLVPKETVGNLNVIVGQDPSGSTKFLNLAKAPHLLTAGSTNSGKTIFLYSIIVSLIFQYSEEELELVIVDPKQTDFIYFEGLPHLRNGQVIIEAEDAVEILTDLVENELPRRTEMLRSSRSRDIFSYNEKNSDRPLKPILVVIDEYADLVQVADFEGQKNEFERNMIRLAQRSRNVGIHLVIATQRPSADIVTSRLKANIPTRISFSLPANQDSRTILDASGAEDLLGKGDMLYSVNGELKRLQGLFISESELEDFLLIKYNLKS